MYVFIKRFLDAIFAMFGLFFLLSVCAVFAPIIWFNDFGTVFYNAPRLGKNGIPFKMFKFRSMIVNAPDIRLADGSTYNSDDDPRITKIGRFLRKTSIDELPQILNVLRGDMSFIGPRPDTVDSLERYTDDEKKVLSIRPGITGYSQAYFRNAIDAKSKLKNDLYYLENISFVFDVRILVKTVVSVLLRTNITNKECDN